MFCLNNVIYRLNNEQWTFLFQFDFIYKLFNKEVSFRILFYNAAIAKKDIYFIIPNCPQNISDCTL